jgi:putative transposase
VWVLAPDGQFYLEVPYRTLAYPPISMWEHKAAVRRLRAAGRAQVDENALFAMVESMRAITDVAAAVTRKARRDTARRAAVPVRAVTEPQVLVCPPDDETGPAATPFEVIEQW